MGKRRDQRLFQHEATRSVLVEGTVPVCTLTVQGCACCWPVLGLVPLWWATGSASPQKRGSTTFKPSQRLEKGKTPERKQGVRVGGFLWPAAHLPPKRSLETLNFPPRCFTFLWGCHSDVRDVSPESCGL